MKVLLINGSPRHKGNTNVALEEIAKQLAKQDIESEILWIGTKPVVTSQYWNILYGCGEGETSLDVEGLQTMRTLANNMAWMLKKLNGIPTADQPEREDWAPMNFIR